MGLLDHAVGEGGHTAININGEVGPYFPNARRVGQGNTISSLLFNIISDALVAILHKAKEAGHIHGVATRILPNGISHRQYADDTLILILYSELDIINLKFLLSALR